MDVSEHIDLIDLVGNSSSQTEIGELPATLVTSFDGNSDVFQREHFNDDNDDDDDDCLVVDERRRLRTAVSMRQWTGWNVSAVAKPSNKAVMGAADKENTQPAEPMDEDTDEDEQDEQNIPDETNISAGHEETSGAMTYWIPSDYVKTKFWTYEPYRGPNGEKVEIIYCKTRFECEKAAKKFLHEKVIGFDMEWKPRHGRRCIQDNISVIQVASETTIALFHIALIKGKTATDLLAPSLRRLIECPQYIKCGVAVNSADGNRLRKWMKLQPRGMFELSYFHRVVWYWDKDPKQIKKKYLSLSNLCSIWLGGPLHKGSVRTSNWTKPLTQEQIRYAASDAYAGVRIYHAIDKRRKASARCPPIPAHTELDLPLPIPEFDHAPSRPKSPQKSPSKPEGQEPRTSPAVAIDGAMSPPSKKLRSTFSVPDPVFEESVPAREPAAPHEPGTNTIKQTVSAANDAPKPVQPQAKQPAISTVPRDPTVRRLYNALCAKRRAISLNTGVDEKMIISDPALRGLAERRPRTVIELQAIPGGVKFAEFGDFDMLAFVQKHAGML